MPSKGYLEGTCSLCRDALLVGSAVYECLLRRAPNNIHTYTLLSVSELEVKGIHIAIGYRHIADCESMGSGDVLQNTLGWYPGVNVPGENQRAVRFSVVR